MLILEPGCHQNRWVQECQVRQREGTTGKREERLVTTETPKHRQLVEGMQ